MLATLLLSNAIVAWHSGAHYFENQANTDYSQFQQPADTKLQTTASVQASQKAPASTTQIHTELCDIGVLDRKSTRLNSSHVRISYAVFCLKKKTRYQTV